MFVRVLNFLEALACVKNQLLSLHFALQVLSYLVYDLDLVRAVKAGSTIFLRLKLQVNSTVVTRCNRSLELRKCQMILPSSKLLRSIYKDVIFACFRVRLLHPGQALSYSLFFDR